MKHNKFLFKPGRATVSRGVTALIAEHEIEAKGARAIADLFLRHAQGDWGKMGKFDDIECPDSVLEDGPLASGEGGPLNKAAVLQELGHGRQKWQGRIMSEYEVTLGGESRRIWIITEADRSSTTALFPEEY